MAELGGRSPRPSSLRQHFTRILKLPEAARWRQEAPADRRFAMRQSKADWATDATQERIAHLMDTEVPVSATS
jgi:hypothetical protein